METKTAVSEELIQTQSPTEPEAELVELQRKMARDLLQLVADRADAEPNIDADFEERNASANKEFDATSQGTIVRFASDKDAAKQEYQQTRQVILKRYRTKRLVIDDDFNQQRDRILREYATDKSAAKNEFQESRWTITAVYEGNKTTTQSHLKDQHQRLGEAQEKISKIDAEAEVYLKECRQSYDPPPPGDTPSQPSESKKPGELLLERIARAQDDLTQLRGLIAPKLFKGRRLIVLPLVIWLLCLYPLWAIWDWIGIVVGTVVLGILFAVLTIWFRALAKSQVRRVCADLFRVIEEAETLVRCCKDQSTAECRERLIAGKKQFNRELRQAADRYRRLRALYKQRRTQEYKSAAQRFREQRIALRDLSKGDSATILEKYRRQRKETAGCYKRDSRGADKRLAQKLDESRQMHEMDWNLVTTNWREGLETVQNEAIDVSAQVGDLFPDWFSEQWRNWIPSNEIPPVIRFGQYQVDLAEIPDGIPQHERLQAATLPKLTMPAVLSFPRCFSLLIQAAEQGRLNATQLLQTVMYRMLTSLPPGKVRFTIVDPVGLGQNFSSFMHLADFDEALVTSRIWTEAGRIEQRLADLTEHMENVFQKYLRNQFESIEDYNAHAGEVAEPYRVLVVANFPSNFNTEAVRRLVSIAASGPRCGVYTLISVDTKQAMPHGFDIRELELPGVHLVWRNGCFVWQDSDFEPYPLQVDQPPPEELGTRLLKQIGARAKEAKRVEVPFEFVAPVRDEWWTADSRRGISVPLGRVGATKRQHLQLGLGTAQHVLIAGKTGSGKSTLLHALINNLALLYSPQEIELYLVDFKKGVEFKTYANHELPHARVIAIESEREFGLSVLQRLDAELKQRAERFRIIGAQDLAGYRQANGNEPMPRILLIVDEFQEFFVEDDRVAQDAALLLDRLVRQGRAFGLHVLLGSQTLGGAYSLARSTIDQMAVRIALQCSENDAHLILSEDNSAARLLSRPGEAIYNDANGLVEGNNPFQVVWLDDARRETYLEDIHTLFQERKLPQQPQVIFEGNIPADIDKNLPLSELLNAPTWPAATKAPIAWLGDAVAIKEPTSANFRARSGNNLLIVGQQEEAALGIMATAILSLAAQLPAKQKPGVQAASFYILDGSLEDSAQAGFLGRLASVLPHPCRTGDWHDAVTMIGEIAEAVERRQKDRTIKEPSVFLIIFDLPRFRELRKADDDFSFSSSGDKPTPAQQFANILREGPGVDVHVLAWCDSMNNLMRTVDRASLREFELRILFQMSANDSSNLIDNPLAAKLGINRAFFHSEEQGRLEKFRPYSRPPEDWLARARDRLAIKAAAAEQA
jgi:S-DNA-T family DNA segregation ATPase FtsK/SpoIIIE